jgi:hypothetical protein
MEGALRGSACLEELRGRRTANDASAFPFRAGILRGKTIKRIGGKDWNTFRLHAEFLLAPLLLI